MRSILLLEDRINQAAPAVDAGERLIPATASQEQVQVATVVPRRRQSVVVVVAG